MPETLAIDGTPVSISESDVVDVGFIGCGSHAFRNIYPTLQFLDLNLVATCDLEAERAVRYADQFGAERSYTDYRRMFEEEDLDAVLIVLGTDDEGHPLYPPMAIDAMRSDLDVWIEKPPAATVDDIEKMQAVEEETGRFVHVGLKKAFTPAIERMKEIIESEEFGRASTIDMRYGLPLPDRDPDERLTHDESLVGLLNITHPGAALSYLGGEMKRARLTSGPGQNGFVTIEFENGRIANLHLSGGESKRSPHERIEVVGDGANVVLENAIRLKYYRPGKRPEYGVSPSYYAGGDTSALSWEPEFSLGQLYNKNLFLIGYWNELAYFADCCRNGDRPERGGLDMAHDVLTLYETLLEPEGTEVVFDRTGPDT